MNSGECHSRDLLLGGWDWRPKVSIGKLGAVVFEDGGGHTCVWHCLQLGVAHDWEAHGVPGEAPVLGLAPDCGEGGPGPLRLASHSLHIGQTIG